MGGPDIVLAIPELAWQCSAASDAVHEASVSLSHEPQAHREGREPFESILGRVNVVHHFLNIAGRRAARDAGQWKLTGFKRVQIGHVRLCPLDV